MGMGMGMMNGLQWNRDANVRVLKPGCLNRKRKIKTEELCLSATLSVILDSDYF